LVGHILYNSIIIEGWKLIDLKSLFRKKLIFYLGTIFLFSLTGMNLTTSAEGVETVNLIIFPVYIAFLTLNCVNALILLCGSKQITVRGTVLLLGTLSFYISDNILGKTQFGGMIIGGDRAYNSLFIMLTYYAGQYLIVHGLKDLVLKLQSEKDKEIEESLLETGDLNS
jgi:uncharacterized membrane protein YhhN